MINKKTLYNQVIFKTNKEFFTIQAKQKKKNQSSIE